MNEIIVHLEGKEYQIDIQKAKALGVIKEKDQRCKSWEEFRDKYVINPSSNYPSYWYNIQCNRVEKKERPMFTSEQLTKEEAIAISAFSKLLKLRRDWIGDWNPDWCNGDETKFYIEVYKEDFYVNSSRNYAKTFSFPTEKMAEEFLHYFRSLFKRCKILI